MTVRVSGDWLTRSATQTVCLMLENAGYQALLVGGCVRNALLDAPVSDIDISTDATPQEVMKLAKTAGLKAIPTGIDHGTITVIAEGIPHEITTFRKDVETDGRRAVVAFSKHVEDDAHRRDFTMNALYARRDGVVVDPLGGLGDLQSRKFRFIDDAEQRIREDYLRILRYFRFHAWYGDPSEGMDPDALSAIAQHTDGLQKLSAERVTAELLKLLSAHDPAPSVAAMRQTGALLAVLEGADDKALALLVHFEGELGLTPDPICRLAALGGHNVAAALRLSKKQAAQLDALKETIGAGSSAAVMAYRHGEAFALQAMVLRSALLEMPLPTDLTAQAELGASAKFPVQPVDLMPAFEGPALGAELRRLETLWIDSGFALDKDALLGKTS